LCKTCGMLGKRVARRWRVSMKNVKRNKSLLYTHGISEGSFTIWSIHRAQG